MDFPTLGLKTAVLIFDKTNFRESSPACLSVFPKSELKSSPCDHLTDTVPCNEKILRSFWPQSQRINMNYQEITREECSEALAKIITVLSEIILDPHENKTSVYPKAAEAFNSIADEVGFNGSRFGNVAFNEDFDRDAAKLFYGVGDTTIGMTHSFWAGGLITVTGKNTHEAFKTYLSKGLQNTSNLPDDHIAVELAFLGHLLAEDKIEEAQQFVKNEILAWWPTAEQNIDSKTQNSGIKAFFASVTAALKFVEAL